MPSLSAFFAPLALLLLPLGAGIPTAREPARQTAEPTPEIAEESLSRRAPDWARFAPPEGDLTWNQVRIERRVVIRISPRPLPARQNLMAELPARPLETRMVERKMGKCVPVAGIVGVQPQRGNRLVLYMRDQRIVAADLEKACAARDFYSGFYVERNEDGNLCIDRDRLQSRTGAKCQLSRMRQLVAVSGED